MSDIQMTALCSVCLDPARDFFMLTVGGRQMVFCQEHWADFSEGVDEKTALAVMDAIDDFQKEELVNTAPVTTRADELLQVAMDLVEMPFKKRDRVYLAIMDDDGSFVMGDDLPKPFQSLSNMALGANDDEATDTIGAIILGMLVFEQYTDNKKSKKGKK